MKHEHGVQVATGIALNRILFEYSELLKSGFPLSIHQLCTNDQFSLNDYCRNFSPHPLSDELKRIVEGFGRKNGIWLDNAKYHITCALYLYPTAHPDRLITIMKILTIGFYLNDIMGRDRFNHLALSKQVYATRLIESLATIDKDLTNYLSITDPVFLANLAALSEIKLNAPSNWFEAFLETYNYHLYITHRENNSSALGRVLNEEEYAQERCHLGGVHYILQFVEYSSGLFLNWHNKEMEVIFKDLKTLHYTIAAFAGLINDLFSFEKEVIDSQTDSNLVAIILLNNPDLALLDAIFRASEIVKRMLNDCFDLLHSIRSSIKGKEQEEMYSGVSAHLTDLEALIKATWVWQVSTKRYKRKTSIWIETQLIKE